MATHDTEPNVLVPLRSSDAEIAAPDGANEAGSSEMAASLLADLAKAPLPAEDVRETEGHSAAAYAVAPHRPPRAHDKTIENAAVVVNVTEPLPPSSSPELSPVSGEKTVPDALHLAKSAETAPSARALRQRRAVLFACAGGAVLAAVAAVAIVALGRPRDVASPASTGRPEAPPASATPAPPPVDPPSDPSHAAPSPDPPPAPAAAPFPSMEKPSVKKEEPATSAARPPSASKPAASSRPSPRSTSRPSRPSRPPAKYAEPERTF